MKKRDIDNRLKYYKVAIILIILVSASVIINNNIKNKQDKRTNDIITQENNAIEQKNIAFDNAVTFLRNCLLNCPNVYGDVSKDCSDDCGEIFDNKLTALGISIGGLEFNSYINDEDLIWTSCADACNYNYNCVQDC